MPAVDRHEMQVAKITAAGVPRFERGRWRIPVLLWLVDHRVFSWQLRFRRRRAAEEMMAQLGKGPVVPRHPLFATVARGAVIAARSELTRPD